MEVQSVLKTKISSNLGGIMPISKKILVVEDDKQMRQLCAEMLIMSGYVVHQAANGAEALDEYLSKDYLGKTIYNLIISDLNMPELDGIAFYKSVVRSHPHLKNSFIFITGEEPKYSAALRSLPDVQCLVKPFRMSQLKSLVERMMASHLMAAVDRVWTNAKLS